MIKKLYLLLFLLFSLCAVRAQLVINGGTLTIEAGASVRVPGNVSSNTDIIGGGKIILNGTAPQEINMNGKNLSNVEVNNPANVLLTGAARITGNLNLVNGKLQIGSNDLSLAPAATITGAGDARYIVANAAGLLKKEVTTAGSYLLPLGTAAAYMPMQYSLAGNTIAPNAFVGGNVASSAHPNKPIRSSDYLNGYWRSSYANITGGTVDVEGTYNETAGLTGAETMLNGLRWNGSDWSITGTSLNTSSNRITYSNVASGSDLYGMNKFVLLTAKVFLQGAFNGTDKMNDNLRSIAPNLLPASDPYRTAPYSSSFTHTANSSPETVAAPVFANQPADAKNVVDWVFLELRNSSYTLLQTRSALLQKDGSIVDVDGVNPVYFNNLDNGSYVVTVRHRNHLGIAADATTYAKTLSVAKPAAANTFDFTTATDAQIFGTALAYKESGGYKMLWAGNVNADGEVRYNGTANDNAHLLTSVLAGSTTTILKNVYSIGDVDMNRSVRYSGPINDNAFLLSNVLGGNASTIIMQQIPN